MALALSGTGGIFTRVGKFYVAATTINTLRGTTTGTLCDNIVAQYASTHQDVISGLYGERDSFRAVFATFLTQLTTRATNSVIVQINDNQTGDNNTPLQSLSILYAMRKLYEYMVTNSDTVNANAVSATPSAGSSNSGTSVCIASVKGPGGLDREYVFAETLSLRCSTDSQAGDVTEGSEVWTFTTPVIQSDQLSWDWPKGSGVATEVTSTEPSSTDNLLTNGDFEDFTTANTPDNWTINAGAVGTNVFQTGGTVSAATNATPIVVTTSAAHGLAVGDVVTIAGALGNTAANGRWKITAVGSTTTFTIKYADGTNSAGNGAYTASSATWSEGASGVITNATNATPIVVTTSEHHGLTSGATVRITGVGGNTAANATAVATVIDNTSFSVPQAGNGAYTSGGTWENLGHFRGSYALKFKGSGAGVCNIQQTFNDEDDGSATVIEPLTVYALNGWMRVSDDAGILAGVLEIALVDGNGVIVKDYSGTENKISISLTTASGYVTMGWRSLAAIVSAASAHECFFRTPATLPATCALRVRFSTDITSGYWLEIDDLAMVEPTLTYQGGPYVAIFPGVSRAVVGDTHSVVVANDWGSKAQRCFQMFFDMRSLALQLPSNSAGGETVSDSLFN